MTSLTLVTGTESTARVLSRQLAEFIDGRVELRVMWIDGGLSGPIGDGLVLLSSTLVKGELEERRLLPPGADVIVARRGVDCESLDEVVALPVGTKALFVNDRDETARDCVSSLVELGLESVEWLPWHPGSPPPPPGYEVAVVAGEPGLVPPGVQRIIDIGVRIFDFSTFAELSGRLGIPDSDMGRFSRRYLAAIVSLARRLARSREDARRVSGHLGSVIDSLRNGILVYDESGRVSVCNEELRALLDLKQGAPAGATLAGMIRSRELLDFLECRCGEETSVFKLGTGAIVVRRFDLGEGGHTVATFRGEVDAAEEAARLAREYRRRGHVAKWSMEDIVGAGEATLRAKRIATRLAATELSILINGESGTGKELFASAIHAASPRAAGPFLAVDLGALSDDLIESELFGYVEGAFTGARKGGKPGLFELADGGTIFLDEIGNISVKVQKRLLRALQEKEIMRVGGSEIRRIDVRVIAATNEDLLARASRGEFREDLYFRLKMGWLRIPPLRERREDIPLLVQRFLATEGARKVTISREALDALCLRAWPGNVRELKNALTYVLAVREGDRIELGDLPEAGHFAESRLMGRDGEEGTMEGRVGVPSRGFPGPRAQADGTGMPPLAQADLFILEAVAALEREGKAAGREAIASLASERGLHLGPGAVRGRMERLASFGYLESSRGPRGTALTQRGRRLIASGQSSGAADPGT